MKKIAIVGAGAYVIGKRDDDFGTIFPALIEYSIRSSSIIELHFFLRSDSSVVQIKDKISSILECYSSINVLYHINKEVLDELQLHLLKGLDALIISVPDIDHYKYVELGLKGKTNCFVVKPLVPTIDECERLVEIERTNGGFNVVDYHKRWDRQNIFVKSIINNNKLGNIVTITVNYFQPKIVPLSHFKKWCNTTNIFQFLGVHYVDLVTYWMPEAMPIRLMALKNGEFLKESNLEVDDNITVIIEWISNSNKFVQVLNLGWIEPHCVPSFSTQNYSISGLSGRINCNQANRGLNFTTDTGVYQEYNYDFCTMTHIDGIPRWFGYGIDSLVNFLSNNSAESASEFHNFKDSLIISRINEAVKKSISSNSDWKLI